MTTGAGPTRAIALSIAGSDPSGGAGIQADLKTFTALGVYGATVITALTAQNTLGVTGIHKVPAAFIRAQFDAVASDLKIAAAKTGMLGDEETVLTVADLIRRHDLRNLVVDPVMVATSGDILLAPEAIRAVREKLIPLARIVTPNLFEAGALLEAPPAKTVAEAEAQARGLLKLGAAAVLVKGGHGAGGEAVDVLATSAGISSFSKPRIKTANTHGTGCTLAAGIAAGLAKGLPLSTAVAEAKDFLWRALESGANIRIGAGSGPVDHLVGIADAKE